MFEIIFGSIWMGVSLFVAYVMYGGVADEISVNGTLVTQEVFNAMLLPKLLIAVFLFIGLAIFILGIKRIISGIIMHKNGLTTDGIITDAYTNATGEKIINVAIIIGNYIEDVENTVDTNNEYNVGDFVFVHYLKKKLDIIKKLDEKQISKTRQKLLKKYISTNIPQSRNKVTVIKINGKVVDNIDNTD